SIREGLEFGLTDLPDPGDDAVIIVSISDSHDPANMYIGKGNSWDDAAKEVLRAIPADRGQSAQWIKVDFVTEILPRLEVGRRLGRTKVPHERSLVGLGVFGMDGPLFIPELIVAKSLINSNSMLRPANVEKYLTVAEQTQLKDARVMDLFRTSAYAWIE